MAVTFTKDEQFLIDQLAKKPEEFKKLDQKNLDRVAGLLVKHMGDMKFNEKLNKSSDLGRFTYKTRDYEAIESINRKVQINKKLANADLEIAEEEKLSLKEMGKIIKFSDLKTSANSKDLLSAKLAYINENCNNKAFKELYANIALSQPIISNIKQNIIESKSYKANDVSVINIKKECIANSENFVKFKTAIAYLVASGYGHTASFYTKNNSDLGHQNKKSHVLETGYETSSIKISDILIADTFKIDATKLVNKNFIPKLQECYGTEWKNQLQVNYENLANSLHNNFETLERSKAKTVIQYEENIVKKLINPKSIIEGHTKLWHKHDFRKISNEMFNPTEENKRMICSEFGAVTIAATIDQLNRMVSFDLQAKGLITKEQEIFKNPIPKNERLDRILPGRLVHLLKKAGAVEVRNETVDQYVKRNDLTSMKTANIELDLPNKILFLLKNSKDKEDFIDKANKNLAIYLEAYKFDKEVIQQIQQNAQKQFEDFYKRKNETGILTSITKFCKGIAVSLHLREKEKSTKKLSKEILTAVEKITQERDYQKLLNEKIYSSMVVNTSSTSATEKLKKERKSLKNKTSIGYHRQ